MKTSSKTITLLHVLFAVKIFTVPAQRRLLGVQFRRIVSILQKKLFIKNIKCYKF